MIAARLHGYHEQLKLDDVDEPKADGPLDAVVRIGAAGLCRTDTVRACRSGNDMHCPNGSFPGGLRGAAG